MSPLARASMAVVLAGLVALGLFYALPGDDGDLPPPEMGSSAPEEPSADPIDIKSFVDTSPAAADAPTVASGPRGVGVIVGTVVDADRVPFANARVQVEEISWRTHEAPPTPTHRLETRSDAEGRFRFEGLAFSSHGVIATTDESSQTDEGSHGVAARPREKKPEVEVELILAPVEAISGFVVDSSGRAVEGARLRPERAESHTSHYHPTLSLALRDSTDDAGAFAIRHLVPGRWRLLVEAPGYAALLSDYIETGTSDVRLVLSRGATIRGTVISRDSGERAVDVRLVLKSIVATERWETTSDGEGRFAFADLRDDEFELTLQDDHRVLVGDPPRVPVSHGNDPTEISLEVASGGIISGRVTDARTDDGMADVPLVVQAEPLRSDISGTVHALGRTKTAADGSYRITGLPAGTVSVQREHSPSLPRFRWQDRRILEVRLGEEIPGVDFDVDLGVLFAGRVVDENGSPLAGARVQGSTDQGTWSDTTTLEDGTFRLLGLSAPDQVYVNAQHPGFALPYREPVALDETGVDGIELVMDPESSISGTVVDTTGRPVAELEVHAMTVGQNTRFGVSPSRTDEAGRFRLGGLAMGEYSLRAQRPQSHSWSNSPGVGTQVSVGRAEAAQGIQVVWDPSGGAISGTVTDKDGNPVTGANVNGNSQHGGAYGQTDEDGRYILEGLAEGIYNLSVHHGSFCQENRNKVPSGSDDIDFKLVDRSVVQGQVVDGRGGAPVTHFRIAHVSGHVDPRNLWANPAFRQVRDDRGEFTLHGVDRGPTTVIVKADEFATRYHHIPDVPASSTVTGIVVEVEQGLTVEGVVLDPEGNPVSGASVFIGGQPNEYTRTRATVATTDDSGRFSIRGFSSGVGQISAWHANFAGGSVEFTPGSPPQPLELTLQRGTAIRGTITFDGPRPANVHVSAHQPQRNSMSRSSTVRDDGSYELTGLLAGSASVNVSVSGGDSPFNTRNRARTVTVRAGEDSQVDFHFPAANTVVYGRILADGVDVQGTHVSLALAGEDVLENYNAQADAEGRYRFERVPAGRGSLMVSIQNPGGSNLQRGVEIEVPASGELERNIDLDIGAVITGHVENADGLAFSFLAALRGEHDMAGDLDPVQFALLQTKVAATMQMNAEGDFRFLGIEPGTYTVVAICFDKQPQGPQDLKTARIAQKIVEIEKDEVEEVQLVLPDRQ